MFVIAASARLSGLAKNVVDLLILAPVFQTVLSVEAWLVMR